MDVSPGTARTILASGDHRPAVATNVSDIGSSPPSGEHPWRMPPPVSHLGPFPGEHESQATWRMLYPSLDHPTASEVYSSVAM